MVKEKLVEIYVTQEVRKQVKEQKKELTYNDFIVKLLENNTNA
tara:strand:- start:714 stop:842 length:129 start_codon:yes stop_codon:yes gene_type:complete